ncbi:hypothetical protein KIL84_000113 [Mauremys mutica]|uniref:Uncharacterized protein n=1 Tax=Mauremys mutica TaxID=74926 RepID=A0A9D4AWB4_9SAUR|nr:hypothetical protein KIL84_000113 [Mauremys mutica]
MGEVSLVTAQLGVGPASCRPRARRGCYQAAAWVLPEDDLVLTSGRFVWIHICNANGLPRGVAWHPLGTRDVFTANRDTKTQSALSQQVLHPCAKRVAWQQGS